MKTLPISAFERHVVLLPSLLLVLFISVIRTSESRVCLHLLARNGSSEGVLSLVSAHYSRRASLAVKTAVLNRNGSMGLVVNKSYKTKKLKGARAERVLV